MRARTHTQTFAPNSHRADMRRKLHYQNHLCYNIYVLYDTPHVYIAQLTAFYWFKEYIYSYIWHVFAVI